MDQERTHSPRSAIRPESDSLPHTSELQGSEIDFEEFDSKRADNDALLLNELRLQESLSKARSDQSFSEQDHALKSLCELYSHSERGEEAERMLLERLRLGCSQYRQSVFPIVKEIKRIYRWNRQTKAKEIISEMQRAIRITLENPWKAYKKAVSLLSLTFEMHLAKALLAKPTSQLSDSDFTRWKSIHFDLCAHVLDNIQRAFRILWPVLKHYRKIDNRSQDTIAVMRKMLRLSFRYFGAIQPQPVTNKYRDKLIRYIRGLCVPSVSKVVAKFGNSVNRRIDCFTLRSVLLSAIRLFEDKSDGEAYLLIAKSNDRCFAEDWAVTERLVGIGLKLNRESGWRKHKGLKLATALQKKARNFERAERLHVCWENSHSNADSGIKRVEMGRVRQYYS